MNPYHFIKATVWCSLIASLFLAPRASAATPSFGERLGWKADQVVVILHVDDCLLYTYDAADDHLAV
jgi:hypothetical protein